MEQRKLNFINAVTSEWNDMVAAINEEFVDRNDREVRRLCDELITRLKHFKSNLKEDAI